MKPYKILLVDDEQEIRESMKRKVDWESLGYVLVGDAENGYDAIEKIRLLEPDVVLTDIKMPYMDGLELVERIKKERSSIEFIIFSGFDDFQYAKQAIKLGVIEYILKPVNVAELSTLLEGIKQKMDRDIEEKYDIERLRERYESMLPLYKNDFFKRIIEGDIPKEAIVKEMQHIGISYDQDAYWMMACIEVVLEESLLGTLPEAFARAKELIPVSVEHIVKQRLKQTFDFEIFKLEDTLCLLCRLKAKEEIDTFIYRLNEIGVECKKILNVALTIGLGEGVHTIEDIKYAYNSARASLKYSQSIGSGTTLYSGDIALLEEQRKDKQMSGGTQIIKDAKSYIQANFANPDLSLEMVCAHLHISQAYFSSLFKKEVGQTYISYLTDLRIKKAILLLNTTQDKTYLIARQVGYVEPNYFSYVFKKKMGVAPSRYQQNKYDKEDMDRTNV